MQILIVAATEQEISIISPWLKSVHPEINVAISGIGCNATAYALTRAICNRRPDLVIQAGIGGSFRTDLPPASAALIGSEVMADLGATDNDALVDIFDLGLAGSDEFPFTDRRLNNPNVSRWAKLGLPIVSGATINCISSDKRQCERIQKKYGAAVESMEGAALHYVCLKEKLQFIQLRTISNFAGERDKRNWKMPEAIRLLNEHLKAIIDSL